MRNQTIFTQSCKFQFIDGGLLGEKKRKKKKKERGKGEAKRE